MKHTNLHLFKTFKQALCNITNTIHNYYYITLQEKGCLETNFQLSDEMITNCDQNSHQIKFWLLNNYKIEVMIEFSDQLSQIIGI